MQRLPIIAWLALSYICAAVGSGLAQAPTPSGSATATPTPGVGWCRNKDSSPSCCLNALSKSADQGPISLLAECQSGFQQCKTNPYCDVTDCFESNQAFGPAMVPAGGPGPVGAGFNVVNWLTSGGLTPEPGSATATPQVQGYDPIPRSPQTITRDTCKNGVSRLQAIDTYFSSTGMLNQHQTQSEAISCLQKFCSDHGWPTQ
jgi:hypothetical protein